MRKYIRRGIMLRMSRKVSLTGRFIVPRSLSESLQVDRLWARARRFLISHAAGHLEAGPTVREERVDDARAPGPDCVALEEEPEE
jgi:hypothetical protein